ncbi:MAG: hypothetical protein ACFBWO_13165 [Paracoccaceae bacterium]
MSQNNVMLAAIGGLLAGIFLSAVADDDDERFAALDGRLESLQRTLGEVASDAGQAEARTARIADRMEAVDALGADVGALAERLTAIETGQRDAAGTQDALAEGLDTGLARLETALGTEAEAIAALSARMDEIADGAAGTEAVAALGERIDDLGERSAALPSATAPAGEAAPAATEEAPAAAAPAEEAVPAEEEAERLTDEIGPEGLVMGFGESRSVGETRVFLSRMDGEDVVLRAGAREIVLGPDAGSATMDGCRLSLAGMVERTAYIARDCEDAAMASSGSQESAAPAQGATTATLGIGQSAELAGTRLFLSRLDGPDVVLRLAGGEDVVVGPSAGTARIGDCRVSLLGLDGRTARLQADC